MKVDRLYIRSDFKNLKGLIIDFDKSSLMTVIVGSNGSGKSNVLEALAAIFESLSLRNEPPFSYRIQYKIGTGKHQNWIDIDADPKRKKHVYAIEVNDFNRFEGSQLSSFEIMTKELENPSISISQFISKNTSGKEKYLPEYVFAYYSGSSDRLEKYFFKHQQLYYKKILYSEGIDKGSIRPLFYAKPYHSQFVLLAFFLKDNSKERKFLLDHLGIEYLDSVHFVIKESNEWTSDRKDQFWGARGVVRDFLNIMFEHSLSPIKTRRADNDNKNYNNRRTIENIHLFIPDLKSLREFFRKKPSDQIFKMLESIQLSGMLDEVRIRVKLKNCDEPVTYQELSEGEQQLLTVLGLLRFTGSSDSLFLLDEPDTHLNPLWSSQYLSFLRDFVPNNEASQLLMVTHHPLTIASLEKEQVQIVKANNDRNIIATTPDKNPRGLGVSGILKSEIFGLISTLDKQTLEDIKKRDDLVAKSVNNELSNKEKKELEGLKEELSSMGFNRQYQDPLYQKFMEVKNVINRTPTDKLLDKSDFEELEKEARKFLKEQEKEKRRIMLYKTLRTPFGK